MFNFFGLRANRRHHAARRPLDPRTQHRRAMEYLLPFTTLASAVQVSNGARERARPRGGTAGVRIVNDAVSVVVTLPEDVTLRDIGLPQFRPTSIRSTSLLPSVAERQAASA